MDIRQIRAESVGENMMSPYYGKYRAVVVDVKDPQQRGRVRVQCPKVLGTAKSAWCEPCVPVAGDFNGDFCLPAIGETLWIEFEGGNPNKPVYSGGWYSESSTPQGDYANATKERTISFNGTKISMKSGGCEISTADSEVLLGAGSASIATADSTVHLKKGQVTIATDTYQPSGTPPPAPIAKTKLTCKKDLVSMSVDEEKMKAEVTKDHVLLSASEGKIEVKLDKTLSEVTTNLENQVKTKVSKDEISFDFMTGNCKGKVSNNAIVLECANGTAKLSMSQNKLIIEAQGVTCEFNNNSLTTLKGLIGG